MPVTAIYASVFLSVPNTSLGAGASRRPARWRARGGANRPAIVYAITVGARADLSPDQASGL